MTSASYLITGDDPSLVSETLSRLLEKLCGDDFVPIEEHGGDGEDSIDLGPVLGALATPPFVADRRIVVLRGAERLDATQAAALAAHVKEPVEATILVLVVSGSGTKSVPVGLS